MNEGDVLILEGEVPDIAAKKRVLEEIAAMTESHRVAERLRVSPAVRMSDDAIRAHVKDALLAECAFNECAVRTREAMNHWHSHPEVEEPLSPQPTPAASHAFEEHTSELRLRVEAPTLVELFAEAGRALALLEWGNGPLPEPEGKALPVSLRSHDRAALLVDWLNELIFHTELEGKVFTDFRFTRLTDRDLDAWIRGARAIEARTLVKAATLHNITVTESIHGAFATVVLDV